MSASKYWCQYSPCAQESDFSCSGRLHKSEYQYRAQGKGEANRFDGEEEQASSLQMPGGSTWWEPDEVYASPRESERRWSGGKRRRREEVHASLLHSVCEKCITSGE